MPPITFAHRGARLEAPENSIPAFRIALEAGVSGLETDVWLSGDGEVVCVHDPVIGRVRKVRIGRTSADALSELGVPRLRDVYGELGTAFELSVDVKEDAAATALLDVAREVGALARLWVCTPELPMLERLRAEPEVRLVHSTHKRAIDVPMERHAFELSRLGIDAMNMHHTQWSSGLVSLFHRFGVRAFAWDVQEVRHLRAVLAIGIDAVYCDRPARMVATVGEWTLEQND